MTDKMGVCSIVPRGQEGLRPQVFGMGILVSDSEIVTCAHVINEAKWRTPAGEAVVSVCFPFPDDELCIEATVDGTRWFPPTKKKGRSDIAVVRLREPAPASVERAVFQAYTLTKASDLPLSVYGFRAAKRADGTWVSHSEGERCTGKIVGSLTGGRGQFDGLGITGAAVQHGFSGAGVYDPNQDAIVGMIVEADKATARKLCQFIDTSTLEARGVAASHVPPLLRAYLECICSDSHAVPAHMIKRSVLRQADTAGSRPPSATPSIAPEPLETAVEREGKLVLLGDPGTGKSTALKYLEQEVGARMLANGSETWIPVRVELKTYQGQSDLASLLAKQVNDVLVAKDLAGDREEFSRFMKSWLNNKYYGFLILLDALDEVPRSHEVPRSYHDQFREAVKPLLKSRHRVVISSRVADYDESLHSLVPFLLVPLQPEEIRDYLEQTLRAKGIALFEEQLASNRQRMELASNALLLKIMVEIINQNPEVTLPRSSGRLLKRFHDEMQRQRQREFRPDVSPDIVSAALGKLAVEMLDRGEPIPSLGDIREWDIPCRQYDLEKVLLESKRSRFLRSDGSLGDPVEFLHLQFSSYFAATYLNALLKRADADYDKILGTRIDDRRWEQAITMLAGISEQASGLVRWLAHQLRLKADVGSLFLATSHWPWWTWIFQFGGPTKVDLLIERWETSVASDDAGARTAVVDALRRVVRKSGWHVRAGRAPIIIRECGSALGALGNIRDDRVLADLDWFIGLEHGPYKQPLPAFFWKPLEQQLFERAREVAVEIRQNAASSN